MLKVEKFEFDQDELRRRWYEKRKQEELQQRLNASQYHRIYDVLDVNDIIRALDREVAATSTDAIERKTTDIKDIWINPRNIKKIETCSNEMMNKNFLRVYMDDGDVFNIEGNSVHEFMVKSVILGNEA